MSIRRVTLTSILCVMAVCSTQAAGAAAAAGAATAASVLPPCDLALVGDLVVAQGFIDLNGNDFDPTGDDLSSRWLQARDGVTTSLELEAGALDVESWYKAREDRAPIHFGVSASHSLARLEVYADFDSATTTVATPDEQRRIIDLVRAGLQQGALGVDLAIEYFPAASREEILRVVELAAEAAAPCFVHVRSAGVVEPGSSTEAVQG
jgi:hypothetical protein